MEFNVLNNGLIYVPCLEHPALNFVMYLDFFHKDELHAEATIEEQEAEESQVKDQHLEDNQEKEDDFLGLRGLICKIFTTLILFFQWKLFTMARRLKSRRLSMTLKSTVQVGFSASICSKDFIP